MAVVVDQHHEVSADTLRVVLGGGQHGRAITRGDRLAESKVCGQDCNTACQLLRAEAHELLDERAAGDQLLRGALFNGVLGARQYCDQRHSLSDADQSNDHREKSVAEASHNLGSNGAVDTMRRRPRRASVALPD